MALSADGKYVLAQTDKIRLYRVIGGLLTRVGTWEGSTANSPYCAFDQTDSTRFVYWDRSHFSIYLNQDAALQEYFPLTGNQYQSVDRYTKELLVYDTNQMKVYN